MFKKKFHWYSVHVVVHASGIEMHDEVIYIPMTNQKRCIDQEFMNAAIRRCLEVELNWFVKFEVLGYLGRFAA